MAGLSLNLGQSLFLHLVQDLKQLSVRKDVTETTDKNSAGVIFISSFGPFLRIKIK